MRDKIWRDLVVSVDRGNGHHTVDHSSPVSVLLEFIESPNVPDVTTLPF